MQPLSRRNFLARGLAGVSLAATAPHFLGLTSRVFAADGPAPGARILVVLQLSGGNDGLSTVIPFADPAYHNARRLTGIKENEVLEIDDAIGLHPSLTNLRALYEEGRFAIVQGVSYPNPNRSHFKSMDVWHAGDERGRSLPTGWLGRAVDACCPGATHPELVVNVGDAIPYALESDQHKPISFDRPESYRWTGNPQDAEKFEELNGEGCGEGEEISWLHRVAVNALASSSRVVAAARAYRPRAEYPRGKLADDLRGVASLIRAGLGTRIFYVSFGGFDTHNAQRNRHENLMRELDGAVVAFTADLRAQGLGKEVLLLSFSEFGRRVAENASAGTDHGVAGPMFLLGDGVKGGLYGKHPSLTDLDQGDLKMEVDFRSVYASVLDGWMGMESRKVLGRSFPKLALL